MGNASNEPSKTEFEPGSVSKTEGGILSKLWRVILIDTNSIYKIGSFINRYHERINRNNQTKPNIVKIKSKGTLLKNAKEPSMTFANFISLLRDVLGIMKVRITIELLWGDGKTITTHQVESKLSDLIVKEESLDGIETKTETNS